MRLNKLFLLFALALPLAVPAAAHAQTAAYAEFTGASLGLDLPHVYGGTFGIYSQKTYGILAIGGDLRVPILTGDNNQTYTGALIGPRLAIKPHVIPVSPYIELLGGVTHVAAGNGSDTDPGYNVVVGGDWTVIPHVDWRVIEYSYGEQHSVNIAYKALSTGVVVRF
jgi:hypothetical protein